eukprot:s2943_g1.t1
MVRRIPVLPAALLLHQESGHLEAAEVLRHPEETHRHLVRAWYKCLSRGPKVGFDDLIEAALLIKAPEVEKVGQDALELCCQVVDLGFRIAGYVVEVKDCRGPSGAAPARVYYARTKEQRKVDEVEFLVPRLRQTSGQAIWQRGGTYQFRLRGCCDRRSAPDPYSLRQVVSDWSPALSSNSPTWSQLLMPHFKDWQAKNHKAVRSGGSCLRWPVEEEAKRRLPPPC